MAKVQRLRYHAFSGEEDWQGYHTGSSKETLLRSGWHAEPRYLRGYSA